MKKLVLFLCVFCLIRFGTAFAQDNVLSVDAGESLGTISPYVYGANTGMYGIIPVDLMDEAQSLNLAMVRFGGGDSDTQDVRTSTLDLFILQARQLNVEPVITVRLLNGTPEAAAEIVRYINIQKGYNVRYWSIGNEPNIFMSRYNAPYYSAEILSQEWRAIATAMEAVDPTIQFIGPDITQYVVTHIDGENIRYMSGSDGGAPLDPEGRDWLVEFLRANGDMVDVVSVHRYPYPGLSDTPNGIATIDGLRQNTAEWDFAIPNLREVVRLAAGRDIPIAITEFNSNSNASCGGEASLDSFYNALWIGDSLARMISHGVEYVTFWDMQGIGNRCWGLLDARTVRPAYYTYLMYTHFGTELVASESSDPVVRIYAARRDDGTLTLIVFNLGEEEATKTLALSNFTPSGDAEVWRFDAEHKAEQIESLALSDGEWITVPGQSMTVFVISGE